MVFHSDSGSRDSAGGTSGDPGRAAKEATVATTEAEYTYMKMKLAPLKLNSLEGFMCATEKHEGQEKNATFLVVIADNRDDAWKFDIRAFWPACDECVDLLEMA